MPSASKKQHNLMEAVAHNPAFAKKVGIPQSVGKDFSNADKGRKFSKGGNTMATKKMNPFAKFESSAKDKAMDKKAMGMKNGGSASSRADGVATKGKTKGTFVKMAKGGKAC